MDELFSCRNCIHNSSQTLLVGRNCGFCLLHRSILRSPERTTCKYLSRKDFPSFVVDEGVKEHAYEFAPYSTIVDLITHEQFSRVPYSEKHAWLKGDFDPIIQILAHSHKVDPTWVFVESLSGGIDGRRLLAHSSLVRRYMANCGTWTSSYRFALSIIKDIAEWPVFSSKDLLLEASSDNAGWDVFFARISCVQEYGFHSGIEELMWATDQLGEPLLAFNIEAITDTLKEKSHEWLSIVIDHALRHEEFFPDRSFGREDDVE